MVSQDGGVPLVSQSWDGNASDSQIFQDRAQALLLTFKQSPTPRDLIADSKLYSQDNATKLKSPSALSPGFRLPSSSSPRSSARRWDRTPGNLSTTRRVVAYLRAADNYDGPLAIRLKGRHQPVIRTP